MQVLDTPDTPTIATLVDHLNCLGLGRTFTGADTLKNLVVKTLAPGTHQWELLVVGVPGDRDVDMKRLQGQLEPAEVAQAEPADLAAQPRLVKGYIGPQILKELGIRYLVDPLVVPGSAWVTGANEPGRHAAAVVRGRDFEPDGEIGAVEIRDGDLCARCGGRLSIARGIEIGHIFQLGRKYATAFGLDALGSRRETDPHHDGVVRRRSLAGRCRIGRATLRRARPGVAAIGCAGRCARRRRRQRRSAPRRRETRDRVRGRRCERFARRSCRCVGRA